jgi:thioredoxin 1
MPDELEAIRERLRAELLARAQAARAGPVELTETTFDAFIAAHELVLVDVWAAWCGPCRTMSPLVDQLARAWGGRVAVAKLDADRAPAIMERYRISGIPTFLWFHQGRLAGRQVGVQPRAAFEQVRAEFQDAPSA